MDQTKNDEFALLKINLQNELMCDGLPRVKRKKWRLFIYISALFTAQFFAMYLYYPNEYDLNNTIQDTGIYKYISGGRAGSERTYLDDKEVYCAVDYFGGGKACPNKLNEEKVLVEYTIFRTLFGNKKIITALVKQNETIVLNNRGKIRSWVLQNVSSFLIWNALIFFAILIFINYLLRKRSPRRAQ